jgi:hypothetical protein
MAYSDFTLPEVTKRFGLSIDERRDLFSTVPPLTPSDFLQTALTENVPLALAIQTEKARSELIIAPILVEVRKLADRRISLFSGVEFTVDPSRGLNGVCDYIISRSPEQLFVRAPVAVIIEAKNENIKAGIAQCTAALVGAQMFNAREGNDIPMVYGVVTTGNIWKFLSLEGATVQVDRQEYYIDSVDQILGILFHIAYPAPVLA